MRVSEILQEDYNTDLHSAIDNILVGAKGAGAVDIETHNLVAQLSNMGYSVDVNSIMSLLSQNPMVANITPEAIKLTSPEGAMPGQGDAEEDTAAQVKDMAAQASKIGP